MSILSLVAACQHGFKFFDLHEHMQGSYMFYRPCESSSTLVVSYRLLMLCLISGYLNLHTAMQVKVVQTILGDHYGLSFFCTSYFESVNDISIYYII